LSSEIKSQITVFVCSNAVGIYSPSTYGYFKGKHLNYEWTKEEVLNTVYGMSLQGWIDQELFMERLFIKNIPDIRPVMLPLDGHSSHYTPELSR